jgi:hypothetical protein
MSPGFVIDVLASRLKLVAGPTNLTLFLLRLTAQIERRGWAIETT